MHSQTMMTSTASQVKAVCKIKDVVTGGRKTASVKSHKCL